METDEQDDESSQDQELPSENDNSQSEGSVGGDNDLENGIGADQKSKGQQQLVGHKKRLFTFQFNNLGNTDFNYIKEETRQIRFDDRQHRLDESSSSVSLRAGSHVETVLKLQTKSHVFNGNQIVGNMRANGRETLFYGFREVTLIVLDRPHS
ncbi:UNVERIFIED_CONTAM: hypothetical protein FKN15_030270 [Acipenser sinensis]